MYSLYKRPGSPFWWANVNGERRSTRQRDQKAADAVARERERRAADPAYAAAHETTLERCLAALVAERRAQGRAKATMEILECKSGHLVRVLDGRTPIAKLTGADVDRFIATRRDEGTSSHTIAKELQPLRGALRLAARRELYHKPPEAILPERFSPQYKPRERWLTPEEVTKLLDALKPRRAACVAWFISIGPRSSEALDAKRGDIDLANGRVRVRGTKTEGADAFVPIISLTRPLLELAVKHGDGEGERLFSPWGNMRRDIRLACERAGIDRCSPNDLRRTLSMWLSKLGVPEALAARMLRHSPQVNRRVYSQLDVGDVGRLIDRQLSTSCTAPEQLAPTPQNVTLKSEVARGLLSRWPVVRIHPGAPNFQGLALVGSSGKSPESTESDGVPYTTCTARDARALAELGDALDEALERMARAEGQS